MNLKIKYISPLDLHPAPYNTREMPEKEMEDLKRSIQEFGMVDPLIVNTLTGYVVGGNQRLQAAIDLGLDRVPVVEVELSESREKALNIALNKIHGNWNMPLLKDLLLELDCGNMDIEITGFSECEIEKLITQVHPLHEDIKNDEANVTCPKCGYIFEARKT